MPPPKGPPAKGPECSLLNDCICPNGIPPNKFAIISSIDPPPCEKPPPEPVILKKGLFLIPSYSLFLSWSPSVSYASFIF